MHKKVPHTQLSTQIIESQQDEITNMKTWQMNWGYENDTKAINDLLKHLNNHFSGTG
ncbi:DUF305 domain-containing protein [Candidatus Saccharibacteria bacterium]|nr:DUF305 domain-containing protein [Candidatus Saccharibacteria bacterium]